MVHARCVQVTEISGGVRQPSYFSCSDLKRAARGGLACPKDPVSKKEVPCRADLSKRGLTSVPDLGKLDCAKDIRVLYVRRDGLCAFSAYCCVVTVTAPTPCHTPAQEMRRSLHRLQAAPVQPAVGADAGRV